MYLERNDEGNYVNNIARVLVFVDFYIVIV